MWEKIGNVEILTVNEKYRIVIGRSVYRGYSLSIQKDSSPVYAGDYWRCINDARRYGEMYCREIQNPSMSPNILTVIEKN